MKINDSWKQAEKDIIIHNDKMNIVESCVDRHAAQIPNKIAFVFQSENEKVVNSFCLLETQTSPL